MPALWLTELRSGTSEHLVARVSSAQEQAHLLVSKEPATEPRSGQPLCFNTHSCPETSSDLPHPKHTHTHSRPSSLRFTPHHSQVKALSHPRASACAGHSILQLLMPPPSPLIEILSVRVLFKCCPVLKSLCSLPVPHSDSNLFPEYTPTLLPPFHLITAPCALLCSRP